MVWYPLLINSQFNRKNNGCKRSYGFETTSKGGIATLDCTRKGGNRVATGIYIAMCFSKDGKQYATTKILIIN